MADDSRARPGAAKEILLVEDHLETAQMLTMVLEDEGYRVKSANRARSALDFLLPRRCGPDLILLDLSLPDMDAAEMVSELRRARADVPPIIVVSAKTARSVEEAARLVGASGVLRKPFPIDALLECIEDALEQRPVNFQIRHAYR
jgi:DNA-binding response OmpR family regulator